jgi:gliding motility-associated-like protein
VSHRTLYIWLCGTQSEVWCKLKDLSLSATGLKYNNWDFEWTTGEKNLKIEVKDEGIYGLTLRKGGCSYSKEVVVKNYTDLWFPNVITPNNDGKNDFYVIRNLTLPVSFSVFNRWGGLVFKDDQYNNNWSAENIPDGVYFYTVNDISECTGVSVKGWLTVIR